MCVGGVYTQIQVPMEVRSPVAGVKEECEHPATGL